MQYLCTKKFTAGGVDYHPGDSVPDGAILPERSGKLLKSGYISGLSGETDKGFSDGEALAEGTVTLFTQEEVDALVSEAVEEAERKREEWLAELQGHAAVLEETEFGAYDGVVQVSVKAASDGDNGQYIAVPARPEEIQQVFGIMQMNAEEGARAIADVKSENVLILLHAADSRKTIKNAAKEQADKIFSFKDISNAPRSGNEAAGTNMEGAEV